VIKKRQVLSLGSFLGILVLFGCSGEDTESGFTLPIIRSATESTVASEPAGSTTTLPIFSELYTIQSGDTLSEIAKIFGVSVDDLISYNAISDPDAIEAGQVLKVPAPATPLVIIPATSTTLTP
jgi:LysM repeat protein